MTEYIPIDDYIRECEKDPEAKAALDEARAWLRQILDDIQDRGES